NPIKDFQAPKQLGMVGIWYKNPDGLYATDDSTADYTVESLVEIERIAGIGRIEEKEATRFE
ncbi:MAG: hypothetical protein SO121_04185, partial [Eggerthellaceae bacterium]|nr:hypothetical protein [Eggerthellaceae bacterium]